MTNYNLFDEKWIDIETKDGKLLTITLTELIKNPDEYKELMFPFPGHNLAVLRFIISLVYAHRQPKDSDEWFKMYEGNPFEPVDEFINKFKPYLDLLDKDKPFMQTGNLGEKKVSAVNKILSQLPAETGVNFFYHNTENHSVNLNIIVPMLISAHLYVPLQAGSGYFKGINSIPLYLYISGKTLKETIMYNVLNYKFLKEEAIDKNIMGNMKKDSDLLSFNDGEIDPKSISMVAGLNWRSRKIKLKVQYEPSVCSINGTTNSAHVKDMYYAPGAKCTNYWWDSMVSRKLVQKDENFNTSADRYFPVWRGYISILIGQKDDKNQWYKPLVLSQYGELCEDSNLPFLIPIKAFGYIFKPGGKAYNGFIDEEMIYSHKIASNLNLQDAIDNILKKTEETAWSLKRALKMLNRDVKNSKGDLMNKGEVFQFWKGLESRFNNLLYQISEKELDPNDAKRDWCKALLRYTWKEFDSLSSRASTSGKGLEKLVKAKKSLSKSISITFREYFKSGEKND